jgi:hypothetical protein
MDFGEQPFVTVSGTRDVHGKMVWAKKNMTSHTENRFKPNQFGLVQISFFGIKN